MGVRFTFFEKDKDIVSVLASSEMMLDVDTGDEVWTAPVSYFVTTLQKATADAAEEVN